MSALCYLVKYKETASRPTTSPPVPSKRGGEARSRCEAVCNRSRKPFGIASLYSSRLLTQKRRWDLGRSCLPPLRGKVGRTTVSRSGNTAVFPLCETRSVCDPAARGVNVHWTFTKNVFRGIGSAKRRLVARKPLRRLRAGRPLRRGKSTPQQV